MLAAGIYLGTRRRWGRTVVYLLASTAPLEVYRTTVGELNVSLFRLSVAIGVATFLIRRQAPSLRAWMRARPRPSMTWRSAALAIPACYLVIALVVLASVALKPVNPFLGLRLAASILIGVLVIALLVTFARDLPSERLLAAIALAASLPILAGCWQVIAFNRGWDPALPFLEHLPVADGLEKTRDSAQLLGSTGIRARATFGDSNHYGAYLIFVIAFASGTFLLALLRSHARAAVSFGALSVAACCAVVATLSRSAWLGCAVALLAAITLTAPMLRARMPRRAVIAGVASIAVVLIGIAPLVPTIRERFDSTAASTKTSNRSHAEGIEFAARAFADDPLFGIGIGGIGEHLDQGQRTSGAHSSYLTTAAEMGLPGLLAMLGAAGGVLLVLARRYRRTRGAYASVVPSMLLAGYCGFLAANVVYDLWWDDFHWIVLGAVVLLHVRTQPARSTPSLLRPRARAAGADRDVTYGF